MMEIISVLKVIICPNQHTKQKQGHTESMQILVDSRQKKDDFYKQRRKNQDHENKKITKLD